MHFDDSAAVEVPGAALQSPSTCEASTHKLFHYVVSDDTNETIIVPKDDRRIPEQHIVYCFQKEDTADKMIIANKSCCRCSPHDDCSPCVVIIIVADDDENDDLVWFGSRQSVLPTCHQEANQPVFM